MFWKTVCTFSLDAGIKVLTIYLLRDTTYIKRVINLAKLHFLKKEPLREPEIMMQYLLKIGCMFHQYFAATVNCINIFFLWKIVDFYEWWSNILTYHSLTKSIKIRIISKRLIKARQLDNVDFSWTQVIEGPFEVE